MMARVFAVSEHALNANIAPKIRIESFAICKMTRNEMIEFVANRKTFRVKQGIQQIDNNRTRRVTTLFRNL